MKIFFIILFVTISSIVLIQLSYNKTNSLKNKKSWFRQIFRSPRTEYAKNYFATITFDNFLKFYAVNPKKWNINYKDKVVYEIEIEPKLIPGTLSFYRYYSTTSYNNIYWETIYDQKCYLRWKEQRKKADRNEEQKAMYKTVLKDIQKDITKKMADIEVERKKEFERIEKEREERLKNFYAAEASCVWSE